MILEIKESIKTGAATYDTLTFQQLNPVLQLLAFVSVITYLYLSFRLIERFYQRLKFNGERDRYLYEFRWLHRLLVGFGLLWLLWIPYTTLDYFYYDHQLSIYSYYPLCLLLTGMIIWMAAAAHLRAVADVSAETASFLKPLLPIELKQKGALLKKAMQANLYYQDPELSLNSLAEKLELGPHELSRIINTVLKKSFNDFINEYRVADVVQKMQDLAYDHITLLGIAFESGFNSQSTFNRIFKQMTGKSPLEYKNKLKKEYPSYNLGSQSRFAAVISYHKTTPKWPDEKLNRNYMFKNYLKIAWRYMLRNKVYSTLNIAGLAAGMAVALLIGLWIYSQYAYDRFLPGYDQLYQVKLNFYHSGEINTQSGSTLPLIDEFKKNYPEVKYAAETDWGGQHSLVTSNKKLDPVGITVGKDFLRMFPYPLLKGNVNSVFADPNSIILTESVAKALFGDQEPMNKVIRIDNQYNIKVTGVMKDVPVNSTLQFGFLFAIQFDRGNKPGHKKGAHQLARLF